MSFFTECALPLFAAFLAVLLLTLGFGFGLTYLDCMGFGAGTGMKTRFAWGCYVETKDGWVPKEYAFGAAHEVRLRNKEDAK
jgi:hypothetical protein